MGFGPHEHLVGLIDDLAGSVEHQEPLLIVNWRKLKMSLGKVRSHLGFSELDYGYSFLVNI
jgi:hypothetical protein